ncbi:hypothetical protein CORC01_03513 [Colletotrichum orchidophilum]|uniref:Uncharacterized protein n=1 Tax=Colletotrichum orchidophilum TaxID=1209926 RepID=A0A1G4BIS6_9PEZI|nr:uncharacterized protein CORC01_03513 [Colletotrichum orchidophilum]OHF01198.1 hypothetical protein CORC01_03513 [Colletotrichum orchidophilum]
MTNSLGYCSHRLTAPGTQSETRHSARTAPFLRCVKLHV